MNFKKLSVMTFVAAMAMAAISCSNEDIVDGGAGTPGQNAIEGEKTWVALNFSVGDIVGTRAVGANGEEPGTKEENSVSSIHLYIFNADGILELAQKVDKTEGTAGAYDGKYLAPAAPVEVTSGRKTFCAILNKLGNIDALVGTTSLADFLKSTQNIKDYASLVATDLMTDGANLMMTGQTDVTLHAGISKEDVTKAATSSDTTDDEANNVVTMNVNRIVAKIDLKLEGNVPNLSVGDLATLSGVKYKVNNISDQVYYFLQNMDDNQVYPTPYYSEGLYTEDWKTYWFEQKDFKEAGASLYMTPNTHMQNNAKVGNTTYALVEGVYAPVAGKIVMGYSTATKDFINATTPLESGKTSIFSYEYSVAFSTTDASTDLPESLNNVKTQLQALVAKRVADKYTAESDIDPVNIEFFANFDEYDAFNKADEESKIYAYLQPVEVKGDAKVGNYQIVMKRWSKKLGQEAATEDTSFSLAPLNIAAYQTAEGEGKVVGLKCYYRINVFTDEFGKAHPMHYSVVRNYSYHVVVTKVNKIGENEKSNVDLPGGTNQDEPIEEATTFMQCNIQINKWMASEMKVELGR